MLLEKRNSRGCYRTAAAAVVVGDRSSRRTACSCPHRPRTPLGACLLPNFTTHVALPLQLSAVVPTANGSATHRSELGTLAFFAKAQNSQSSDTRRVASFFAQMLWRRRSEGDRWTNRYYSNAYWFAWKFVDIERRWVSLGLSWWRRAFKCDWNRRYYFPLGSVGSCLWINNTFFVNVNVAIWLRSICCKFEFPRRRIFPQLLRSQMMLSRRG